MSDTVRIKEHLVAGREYTRNVTTTLTLSQVDEIGRHAIESRRLLEEVMDEDGHEILNYELVVRVVVRAGGEIDAGGGQEPVGDDVT